MGDRRLSPLVGILLQFDERGSAANRGDGKKIGGLTQAGSCYRRPTVGPHDSFPSRFLRGKVETSSRKPKNGGISRREMLQGNSTGIAAALLTFTTSGWGPGAQNDHASTGAQQ